MIYEKDKESFVCIFLYLNTCLKIYLAYYLLMENLGAVLKKNSTDS